jgi:hypothetical protein
LPKKLFALHEPRAHKNAFFTNESVFTLSGSERYNKIRPISTGKIITLVTELALDSCNGGGPMADQYGGGTSL